MSIPNVRRGNTQRTGRVRSERNITSIVNRKVNEELRGKVLRARPTPPVFSLQPWNNVTVRDKLKITGNEHYYKIQDLARVLRKQVGAYTQAGSTYTGCGIEFQIHGLIAWNISDLSGGFLRLLPMDFLTGTDQSHELQNISSNATKNQYAACGFIFPSSHQQHVHYLEQSFLEDVKDSLGTLVLIDVNSQSDVELHVTVRWRLAMGSNIKLDYVSVCGQNTVRRVPESLLKTIEALQRLRSEREAKDLFTDTLETAQESAPDETHHEEQENVSEDFERVEKLPRRSSRLRALSTLLRDFSF